jgi:hypothetical protein
MRINGLYVLCSTEYVTLSYLHISLQLDAILSNKIIESINLFWTF